MIALAKKYSPSSRWENLRYLERAFLREHRATAIWSLVAMLLQSLLLLPVPWLQGNILDRLVAATGAGAADDSGGTMLILSWLIGAALAATVVCHVGRTFLGWAAGTLMSRAALEVVRALTDTLHRKLQRMPMAYFDRQETGQLMARLTNDVGTLMLFLNAGSLQLAADLVLAAGIVAALLILSWPLAVVSLAVLPLFVFNHIRFAARIAALSRQGQHQAAGLYALLSERVSGIRTVRAFGQERAEEQRFEERLAEQTQIGQRSLRASITQGTLAMLIGALATGGLAALAATMIGRQWLTFGEAVAFLAYVGLLYLPLVRLTQWYGGASATLAAVDRIAEVLMEPEPMHARPPRRRPVRPRGELALRNVSFRYRPQGPLILDGVHLRVEAGMTVGIHGPSGTGKSTLLALIPRLYELPEAGGRILLDGCDVRRLALPHLRRSALLVPQQPRLFTGTIQDNLTYPVAGADPRALRRALEAVDLLELIESLPQGLDTWVSERGCSLSGGQRQRLALARALVINPPILLLDDCTSALDAETEARVRRGIASFRPAQTRLVVSHKPESFEIADLVVALDQGRIVRQGWPACSRS